MKPRNESPNQACFPTLAHLDAVLKQTSGAADLNDGLRSINVGDYSGRARQLFMEPDAEIDESEHASSGEGLYFK